MAGIFRSFVQSLLKLVNSIISMAGLAIVLYGLWMLRVWHLHTDSSSSDYSNPWFIYSFLGLGIAVCFISFTGYIAAETLNGCCLYIYMAFLILLFMLQAVLTADVLLNHNWEEDFPVDETGNLNELEDFVKKNFDFCRWIGLSVLVAQGLSFLLTITLKALGPNRDINYETDDDDYEASRVPLLRNAPHSAYTVGEVPAKCSSIY